MNIVDTLLTNVCPLHVNGGGVRLHILYDGFGFGMRVCWYSIDGMRVSWYMVVVLIRFSNRFQYTNCCN